MKPVPKSETVRRQLLRWYTQHKRDLPWRQTRDPYRILVSEVMLQQTQVDRVIPKYRAWLKSFPTVQSLARAPLRQVLKLWSGLGYNNRAIRLRQTARTVASKHDGKLPQSRQSLEALPGIGGYTAGAVMSFAFKKPVGLVETNIRRVTGRVWYGLKSADEKTIQARAEKNVPRKNPDLWHHALMDLGAMVCVSRRPKCEQCPLQTACRAYPQILTESKKPIAPARPPFTSTDRYWRGQIIKTLIHSGQLTIKKLQQQLPAPRPLPLSRLQRLVRDLLATGLVSQRGQRVSISQ